MSKLVMPRKSQCYWTRKLELDLVEFVRRRECIWKPAGNTNHHIQQKYRAYAEFAATLGRGFTARAVRDRWVNIRSTFNHNLRRVDRSRQTATSPSEMYVPCWPLWKPLQFLRNATKKEFEYDPDQSELLLPGDFKELTDNMHVKEELPSDIDDAITIRQRGKRTDRPRKKVKLASKSKMNKCKNVIDDLVKAMRPLTDMMPSDHHEQGYWFFGKHVTERLNSMREVDAECARNQILKILEEVEIRSSENFENIHNDILNSHSIDDSAIC